jgi:hypothetical protein
MILPVSALYPLAKRYTKYPQAVLGSAFNSGSYKFKIRCDYLCIVDESFKS